GEATLTQTEDRDDVARLVDRERTGQHGDGQDEAEAQQEREDASRDRRAGRARRSIAAHRDPGGAGRRHRGREELGRLWADVTAGGHGDSILSEHSAPAILPARPDPERAFSPGPRRAVNLARSWRGGQPLRQTRPPPVQGDYFTLNARRSTLNTVAQDTGVDETAVREAIRRQVEDPEDHDVSLIEECLRLTP